MDTCGHEPNLFISYQLVCIRGSMLTTRRQRCLSIPESDLPSEFESYVREEITSASRFPPTLRRHTWRNRDLSRKQPAHGSRAGRTGAGRRAWRFPERAPCRPGENTESKVACRPASQSRELSAEYSSLDPALPNTRPPQHSYYGDERQRCSRLGFRTWRGEENIPYSVCRPPDVSHSNPVLSA